MAPRDAAPGVGDGWNADSAGPIDRIDSLDILRGLALSGVLAINLVFEFRVSIFEQFLPPVGVESDLDRVAKRVLAVAVQSKALALFSILFGVGLAIQFERLAGNPRRPVLLVRRLAALLAIGVAHLCLVWNGDILVEYSVAGLVVLPFLFAARWVVLVGAAGFLGLYLAMPLLPPVAPLPVGAWLREHVAEATRAYGTGGILDVLAFRLREIPVIFPLHVEVFPRTVALFLAGILVWRSGVPRRAPDNPRLLTAVAAAGILLGGGLTIATDGPAPLDWPALRRALESMARLGAVVLAAGYAASVVGLASGSRGRKMLAWAAPVGRMAFTNYIAQSLVLGWIFYGYGLGLIGRLDVAAACTIGLALYATQIAFSAWWLGRYRHGPVEWLWRTAMYGARQPMVRRAT